MSEQKLVTFLDEIGRTIIAEYASETTKHLKVKNPVVINVVPQQDPQTGQQRMSLQLFPLFFREFLADKEQAITWKYVRDRIIETEEEVVFDFKLHAQYNQIFAPIPEAAAAPTVQPVQPAGAPANNNVIKLFDD